jgi:hypothetical protein
MLAKCFTKSTQKIVYGHANHRKTSREQKKMEEKREGVTFQAVTATSVKITGCLLGLMCRLAR